jgi:CreA protein
LKKIGFIILIIFATAGVILIGMLIYGVDLRKQPSIGSVDTEWKMIGADSKIAVDAFDDPKIDGVACFISRTRIGGVTGALGLREDTSDASVACRQVGPIRFREPIEDGERVFKERRSILFKTLQVVRFYDAERRTLIYLGYSDRIVTGSPKNTISAVPLLSWEGQAPGTPPSE